MTARPGRRAESGFTLVECVVSLGILALAGVIAAGAIVSATQAGIFARERSEALFAAELRMERLLALTNLADLGAAHGLAFDVEGLAPVAPAVAEGDQRVDVTQAPLVGLEVRVRWRSALGSVEEIVLRTETLLDEGGTP